MSYHRFGADLCWYTAYHCGELSRAVLSGDRHRFFRCLSSYPQFINEENLAKVTPLWLACRTGWTEAASGLLNAGACCDFQYHSSPLCAAAKAGSKECSALLLNQSALKASQVDYALRWLVDHQGSVNHDVMIRMIVEEAADPRRRLFDLAKSVLDSEMLSSLELRDDRILDGEQACKVALKVKSDGDLPEYLVGDWSRTVYHRSRSNHNRSDYNVFSPQDCDVLWHFGFRDVNGVDEEGLTPLMAIANRFKFHDHNNYDVPTW